MGNDTSTSQIQAAKNEDKQMIKIDKACMQCNSQNTNLIKNAFKIACLAYQPSPVEFGGKKYTKEILAINNKSFVEKLMRQFN